MGAPGTVPIRVTRGFKGLNLSVDPRQLGPEWATMCCNVHVAHGAVERRCGKKLIECSDDTELPMHDEWGGTRIRAVYFHTEYDHIGGAAKEFVLAAAGKNLYTHARSFTVGWPWALLGGSEPLGGVLTPTFVRVSRGHSLVLDGTYVPRYTDGYSLFQFGLTPPDPYGAMTTSWEAVTDGEGLIVPAWSVLYVRYALSYAKDADVDTPIYMESNGGTGTLPEGSWLEIVNPWAGTTSAPIHVTVTIQPLLWWTRPEGSHFRLYRATHVTALTGDPPVAETAPPTQPAFYSLARIEDPADLEYIDDTPLLREDRSKVVPTRNALPPPAAYAVEYGNRMFYAMGATEMSGAHWDLLWYSAENEWAHVAEENWIQVGTDGAAITGLAVYFGQLIIFKESGIWKLAGWVDSATNESDAAGLDPPVSPAELVNVVRDIGCVNKHGGVSHVEADGILYFAGRYGFYAFNGQTVKCISDAIKGLLMNRGFDETDEVSVAHDEKNGLILWAVHSLGTPGFGEGPSRGHGDAMSYDAGGLVLVYHYKDMVPSAEEGQVGAWTIYYGLAAYSIATMRRRSLLSNDQFVLIGQNDGRVSYLDYESIDDQRALDSFTSVWWEWQGPQLHLTPESVGHWAYLMFQCEPPDSGHVHSGFFLDFVGDDPTANDCIFNIAAGVQPDGFHLRRLGHRSRYFIPRFYGMDPVRLLGYELEAKPIGFR